MPPRRDGRRRGSRVRELTRRRRPMDTVMKSSTMKAASVLASLAVFAPLSARSAADSPAPLVFERDQFKLFPPPLPWQRAQVSERFVASWIRERPRVVFAVFVKQLPAPITAEQAFHELFRAQNANAPSSLVWQRSSRILGADAIEYESIVDSHGIKQVHRRRVITRRDRMWVLSCAGQTENGHAVRAAADLLFAGFGLLPDK